MHVILDHLTAVIVGTILLSALLVLQLRERTNSLEEAMRYQLQTRGESVMSTLGHDLDNMMTAEEADVQGVGLERCRIKRDGDDFVKEFECPSFIQMEAGGAYEPAEVKYKLKKTGERLMIGGVERRVYRLEREVKAASGKVKGDLSEAIIGFDVETFGSTGAVVDDGEAPADINAIRVMVELAHEGLPELAGDQGSERAMNLARFGHTFRPPNLVYRENNGIATSDEPEDDYVYTGDDDSGGGGDDDDDDDDD